jgi:hypothetical protein
VAAIVIGSGIYLDEILETGGAALK